MGRIVNSTYISLDGLTEKLDVWHFDYRDDETAQVELEQVQASEALLMGRLTYEGFAAAWPSQTGAVADKLNSMKKYVASTSLKDPSWSNTTVISGDLVAKVAEIKQQTSQDILMYGFGPVARTLFEHNLLDEIRFWVHPVFAGKGSADDLLFREGEISRLKLVNTRTLKCGVVVLSYQPVQ